MSDVANGAVWTLVVPLALLMLILGIWAITQRDRLRRTPPVPPRDAEKPRN